MRFRLLSVALPLLATAGCSSPRGGDQSDTFTVGQMRLVAAESARPLALMESEAFSSRYRGAHIALRRNSTRGAIADLFGARADAIMIPRELSPEEAALAASHGLKLQGYRLAVDALALVVHPANPVEQTALD